MQGFDFFVIGICGGSGLTIGYFITMAILKFAVESTEKLIDYLELKSTQKEEKEEEDEYQKWLGGCPHCGLYCGVWNTESIPCGKVDR